MPKPEIARRCPICGASIREAAAYCPQCGETLAEQSPEEKPRASAVTTPLVESSPARDEAKKRGPRATSAEEKQEPIETAASVHQKAREGKAPVGKVRNTIQRASTLARDVEGDVIHRVKNVRRLSNVVLDEAGYDPSLRFVLVAAVLFLLFLLVLVLNKVIV